MNRQIKFRAWDDKKKCFISDEFLISHNNGGNIQVIGISIYRDSSEINEDIYLMQYTGLKDKNGVEIYEKDLLSNGDYIFEVQFNVQQGKWCLNPIKYLKKDNNQEWFITALEYQQLGNGYYSRKDLEIIGNLHKSPELLNN
jgi:uncharacterized phage protein (TIGR01671 family)